MKKLAIAAIMALSIISRLGAEGAEYVIIVPDAWAERVQPLADWKTRKGMPSRIVTLTECGSSASEIKNYLVNAYNTWDPRPHYVLLVGAPDIIPFGRVNGIATDSYYGDMEGNFKNELLVGRFSVTTGDQAAYMVYKTIMYESQPYMEDSTWFMKGMTIVREDGDADDSIYYWYDARMAHRLWNDRGFVHIDSFSRFRGNDRTDVLNGLNDGRSIVIFRGQSVGHWWSPFDVDVDNMDVTQKWPFVIGATCRTISGSGDYNMDREFTLAGDISNPKGSIGYFGTTTVVSGGAWRRSYVTRGFLLAMYGTNTPKTLGEAAESGRMYLYQQTGNLDDYYGFQLIGDPELHLWTHTPRTPNVIYPEAVSLGVEDTVNITVYYPDKSPVRAALVAIHSKNSDDVYVYGYTNSVGEVSLVFTPNVIDTLELAVSGSNLYPTFYDILMITEGPYIAFQEDSVMEISGNSDGYLNPGETASLGLEVKNIGIEPALEVVLKLSTQDTEYVDIQDSIEQIEHILPGNVVYLDSAFVFEVSPDIHKTTPLHFTVEITDADGDTWRMQLPPVYVITPLVEVVDFQIDDSLHGNGDGRLSPTEQFALTVTLRNTEPTGLNNLDGELIEVNNCVILLSSTVHFGEITGNSTFNSTPAWMLVSNTASAGDTAVLEIALTGQGETYTYLDTVELHIPIGTQHDPYGPDAYGYWAYDNTDSASGEAPPFDWFEIATPAGGPGEIVSEITDEDADTVTVPLPFRFKFYGLEYDSIGLCSNGFMEFYRSSYRFGDNMPIPSPGAPRRMLAPFWDDLDPSLAGDIYQYYDSLNHRWILEFYQVAHYGESNTRETFQVQLLDPQYYPTPTGDGIILFLYNHVADASSATIGIEDHTNMRGIQYEYNNIYHVSSAVLQSGRAIKFSTEMPVYYPIPQLQLVETEAVDTVNGNGNGLIEPGETFALTVMLTNTGGATVHRPVGILNSTDLDIAEIPVDSVTFPDVDSLGGSAANMVPFVVRVADSVSDTILELNLHVFSDSPSYESDFEIRLTNLLQGIDEDNSKPDVFVAPRLHSTIVRNTAVLKFSLPVNTPVKLELFDISGRQISRIGPEIYSKGSHIIAIPMSEKRAGIYFVVLQIGERRYTRKFILID